MTTGALASGDRQGTPYVEPDSRQVPWATLERLALEGGRFPRRYQPVSEDELAALLDGAAVDLQAGHPSDRELLHFWRDRYEQGGGWQVWSGCPCKETPPEVRLRGRAQLGWQELGDPVPGEAGLSWGPGLSTSLEAEAQATAGLWWLATTVRLAGRIAPGGTELAADDPLAWPDWQVATGRADVRRARLQADGWRVDVPRAVAGVRLGNWALTAGWAPRRVGPGHSGGLTLDRNGASFPALTGRRTRPFRWRGFMKWLAPDDLLLRVGHLSSQDIRFNNESGVTTRRDHPWFFEWLVGWQPLSWFRLAATHTAMAAAEEGTLWPDLPQINFPIVGTTWTEKEAGPATDRLFALQFEGRWRDAPWPLLPSRAGRLWWEYGGTDFRPYGPGGIFPQVAAPASVVGVALYDPLWDLGFEYTELLHPEVLWYSNSGFPEGYSHESWLMGHSLGGSGEAFLGTVRVRVPRVHLEAGLEAGRREWGEQGPTPGSGYQWSATGTLGNLPRGEDLRQRLWSLNLAWFREASRPLSGATQRMDAWRMWAVVGLP